jgi:hypothetical protein
MIDFAYLLRNRVIWSLHRWVHLNNARAELLRVGAQVFVIGIHGRLLKRAAESRGSTKLAFRVPHFKISAGRDQLDG